MNGAGLRESATGRHGVRLPRDFHFALGFAVLAALLHTSALLAELVRASGSNALTSPVIPQLFLLIELGLLVNVAGLWLRKVTGILVSLAALSVAGLGYALWYLSSRQILELLMSKPFYHEFPQAVPPHPFGLVGATWVNLVVLVMAGVLFVWQLKRLCCKH